MKQGSEGSNHREAQPNQHSKRAFRAHRIFHRHDGASTRPTGATCQPAHGTAGAEPVPNPQFERCSFLHAGQTCSWGWPPAVRIPRMVPSACTSQASPRKARLRDTWSARAASSAEAELSMTPSRGTRHRTGVSLSRPGTRRHLAEGKSSATAEVDQLFGGR